MSKVMNCCLLHDPFLLLCHHDRQSQSQKINPSHRFVLGINDKYRRIILPQLAKHVTHLCKDVAPSLSLPRSSPSLPLPSPPLLFSLCEKDHMEINPSAVLKTSCSSYETAENTRWGDWWVLFGNLWGKWEKLGWNSFSFTDGDSSCGRAAPS